MNGRMLRPLMGRSFGTKGKAMAKTRTARFMLGTAVVTAIGAAGIIAVIGWSNPANDAPPLYAYEDIAPQVVPQAATDLAALIPGATVSTVALRAAEPNRVIANAQVVKLPDETEVIVGWASDAPEPILRSDVSAQEELLLVTALHKYLPENSTILAMPTFSARLAHFVAADYPLAAFAGQEVLRLPGPWLGQQDAVAEIESRWFAREAGPTDAFGAFIDALLAEDVYGAARLQTLAGPNDSYIILHVRDVFDLGISVPDRILVSQRDFPAAGIAHDKARAVKDWAKDENYAAYAVERREGGAVRAYYLAEAKAKSTLLGQLLPFNTADLGQVAGTTLVFQTGGYWIYRLQPLAAAL